MGKRIRIRANTIEVTAELNNTKTAEAIWEALPVRSQVSLWGEEIYFSIPIHLELENGQELVDIGDLGYWPPGSAFCIFFGPTPTSRGEEIRPASPVSVFGKVVGDAKVLSQIKQGAEITVEREQP
ncbi:hypothetical protein ES703_31904 [subsurface metagenome]